MNCFVFRNHGYSSSAFLWVVAVILFLLYFLFLLVYLCINFFVASGTVGTGGCFAIGIEVVVGRDPGCWVDKELGEGSGKDWGGYCMVK